MSDKHYWLWDKETKVVDHNAIKAQCRAGQYHIPRSALKVEPKPKKDGFKVIVVLDNNLPIGTEYVEEHVGKMIFDESDCTKFKPVEKLGVIPDGWTSVEPQTPFDEWFDGSWVTNKSNKYIAEYNQIDDKRRTLYSQMCDPLKMEAMDLMDEGKEAEALQLKHQALAAKQKIKAENPWPTPPEN
ncbi:hypothetical protein OH456_12705 [Vibrio sp. La 4.2.2]|uniref:hypothetical protein n=1 Tax=Vibrio sp. La 4.2.2 TaxID=2998830 RepID=UPI0022CDEF92|nr:hypothetical protein [Vibrio sp. La 4.2.2]MDA0109021.1 hypothetical protein [Vibrio sp. La 4.2.2]